MVELLCLKCGYRWDGRFESMEYYKSPSCPKCNSKLVVEDVYYKALLFSLVSRYRDFRKILDILKCVIDLLELIGSLTPKKKVMLLYRIYNDLQSADNLVKYSVKKNKNSV